MGTVGHLAEEIERGLRRVHPGLRKTVTRKLAATVAAVLQTQAANTAARAAVLPIETERDDMRCSGSRVYWPTRCSTACASWSRSPGTA